MKLALFAVFLTASGCVAGAADTETGRYQLVVANAPILSGTDKGMLKGENASAVLRIDTKTGKTWILIRISLKEKYDEFWKEISEQSPITE